ncbi:MAG: hypothetical protein AAGA73_09305 [Pseudomonadota bacterium]
MRALPVIQKDFQMSPILFVLLQLTGIAIASVPITSMPGPAAFAATDAPPDWRRSR